MLGCQVAPVKCNRTRVNVTPSVVVRLDGVQEALEQSSSVAYAPRHKIEGGSPSVNDASLERKLRARSARIAIIGLGYAGLPMAVELAGAGFPIVGFDVDAAKVKLIGRGRSPVSNVADAEIGPLVD